jgi:DNA-binding GntR family transcriptional regulator
MPASTDRPTAWNDVYRDMRLKIQRSDIEPGAALPTISDLSSHTELTRHGARRVLERLCEEGLANSWLECPH